MILATIAIAIYLLAIAIAMTTDIISLRIPDWISAVLAATFFAAAALTAKPVDLVSHVAAGVLILLVGVPLFAWDKIGGGDVKLLAAVSLWNGLPLLPALVLTIGIACGMIALACIALRRLGVGPLLEARGFKAASLGLGRGMPFAAAVGIGCGVQLPHVFLACSHHI